MERRIARRPRPRPARRPGVGRPGVVVNRVLRGRGETDVLVARSRRDGVIQVAGKGEEALVLRRVERETVAECRRQHREVVDADDNA